jgi:hypothetical protein
MAGREGSSRGAGRPERGSRPRRSEAPGNGATGRGRPSGGAGSASGGSRGAAGPRQGVGGSGRSGGAGAGRGAGAGKPYPRSSGGGRPSSDGGDRRGSERRGARPTAGDRRDGGRGRDRRSDEFSKVRPRDERVSGSRTTDENAPPIPENVDPTILDRGVKAELRSLSKLTADAVARYLVAAGESLDDDPQKALAYARAARNRAARVGAVREAVGIAAYHAGEWAEALTELRTARRISGDARNLAVMADCERALGRPAQALRLLSDPGVNRLDPESRVELFIVIAGARRDLGQLDAALAVLSRGGLDRDRPRAGAVRLWYAYADALEAAGRLEEAAQWFAASAAIDPEGELDAVDRAANLL